MCRKSMCICRSPISIYVNAILISKHWHWSGNGLHHPIRLQQGMKKKTEILLYWHSWKIAEKLNLVWFSFPAVCYSKLHPRDILGASRNPNTNIFSEFLNYKQKYGIWGIAYICSCWLARLPLTYLCLLLE